MRTKIFFVAMFALLIANPIIADDSPGTKTGWNFGVLPAVSFNSDLGFQYGGLINLFHYGDGSRYPTYDHMLYFEISRYTKGSGLFGLHTTVMCLYRVSADI
jgi:hypothetical protein